jgi:hypothetical protein
MIEQIKNAIVLILIVGVASVISAVLEAPLSPLLAFLEVHQTALLTICAILTCAGFITFMGMTLYILLSPQPPSSVSSTAPPIARSSTAQRWSASTQFQTEASYASIKVAMRNGDWRRDRQWRLLFITMAGALVMSVGLVCLFLVLAPLAVKLIILAAVAYAVAVVAWGFASA